MRTGMSTSLLQLPDELLLAVVQYFPPIERYLLFKMFLCKRLNAIVWDNKVWKAEVRPEYHKKEQNPGELMKIFGNQPSAVTAASLHLQPKGQYYYKELLEISKLHNQYEKRKLFKQKAREDESYALLMLYHIEFWWDYLTEAVQKGKFVDQIMHKYPKAILYIFENDMLRILWLQFLSSLSLSLYQRYRCYRLARMQNIITIGGAKAAILCLQDPELLNLINQFTLEKERFRYIELFVEVGQKEAALLFLDNAALRNLITQLSHSKYKVGCIKLILAHGQQEAALLCLEHAEMWNYMLNVQNLVLSMKCITMVSQLGKEEVLHLLLPILRLMGVIIQYPQDPWASFHMQSPQLMQFITQLPDQKLQEHYRNYLLTIREPAVSSLFMDTTATEQYSHAQLTYK